MKLFLNYKRLSACVTLGLLALMLTSCLLFTPKYGSPRPAKVTPDELPVAKVGQPYKVNVDVETNLSDIYSEVTPSDMGIKITIKLPEMLSDIDIKRKITFGREFLIEGIPKQAGEIKIFFKGVRSSGPPSIESHLEKNYILKVEE